LYLGVCYPPLPLLLYRYLFYCIVHILLYRPLTSFVLYCACSE